MNHFDERVHHILGEKENNLKKIPEFSDEYFQKAQKNCENMIGTVSVPVGITSPLLIHGKYANGEFIVPLATTEGCLIASISRGAKAITHSGGAKVSVTKVGITRAPVFRVESEEKAQECQKWLEENLELLQIETKKTSNYLELLKITTKYADGYFFIKFFFDAKDAMGMNMATIACDVLIREIVQPQLGIECISVSGNYCCDKKPAKINIIEGRGFWATAEAIIPKAMVAEILKTTPEKIAEVYKAKIVTGSELAGALGHNAHVANIIAAVFLATGQDMAHVVEGSNGMTTVKVITNDELQMINEEKSQKSLDTMMYDSRSPIQNSEKKLYGLSTLQTFDSSTSSESEINQYLHISVTLPSLVCGVIGGGTGLPKQQEALKFLGVLVDQLSPGSANHKFAEIIVATVLAGELSLLSALASKDLANAHEKARKR